jgi:hypothetical protein
VGSATGVTHDLPMEASRWQVRSTADSVEKL